MMSMSGNIEAKERKKMDIYDAWAGQVREKIRNKISRVSEKNKEKIPYMTGKDGAPCGESSCRTVYPRVERRERAGHQRMGNH